MSIYKETLYWIVAVVVGGLAYRMVQPDPSGAKFFWLLVVVLPALHAVRELLLVSDHVATSREPLKLPRFPHPYARALALLAVRLFYGAAFVAAAQGIVLLSKLPHTYEHLSGAMLISLLGLTFLQSYAWGKGHGRRRLPPYTGPVISEPRPFIEEVVIIFRRRR